MNGKALLAGLTAYLASLVVTIIFPLQWMRSLRMARRHADADPRAVLKVAVAIVASIGILAVGAFVLLGVQSDAKAGMYDSLDSRLSIALGESEYKTNVETVDQKIDAIATIQGRIDAERAAGNSTTVLEGALATAQSELANARANITAQEPNHQLFLQVDAASDAQDDARIRSLVAASTLAKPTKMVENTEAALDIKDEAVRDMQGWFYVILWPSLAGAFFAPLAFVHGSILKAAFVPSDTVGFKAYPGAAAGLFLLFGAFGLPSIPFAAWTNLDAEKRSVEGQIAL